MHARLDGVPIGTFPKPDRRRPWVLSGELVVDDQSLVVYAETRNAGDWVTCDVFADGRSLLDRAPIETLEVRQARTDAANAAYVSPLEAVSFARGLLAQAAWLLPLGFLPGFSSSAGDHPADVVWSLYAVYVLAVWCATLLLRRLANRAPASGVSRRLAAALIVVVGVFGVEVGLGVLILFGPLRPSP